MMRSWKFKILIILNSIKFINQKKNIKSTIQRNQTSKNKNIFLNIARFFH